MYLRGALEIDPLRVSRYDVVRWWSSFVQRDGLYPMRKGFLRAVSREAAARFNAERTITPVCAHERVFPVNGASLALVVTE